MQFWLSRYRKDVNVLKRVRKGFTRLLPGLEDINLKKRLDKPGLLSLERQKLRGQLIEVSKIMRGKDMVDSLNPFPQMGNVKD